MNTQNIILLAGVAVVAVVFLLLWQKGYLLRLSGFFIETREELKKCTWPSAQELRGSTVVVLVAIVLLGAFTVVVDFVITSVVHKGLLEFFS